MTIRKYDEYEVYEKDDVQDMIDRLSETNLSDRLLEEIHNSFEKILKPTLQMIPAISLFDKGVVLKANMPHVTLRTKTIRTILDTFRLEIGDRYYELLQKVGFTIGSSFGKDFVAFLTTSFKLPKDYETLVSAWTRFDSSAGFGNLLLKEFKLNEKGDMHIALENSFLVENEQHTHCQFLSGYIKGVISEAFFFYYFFLDVETKLILPPLLKPIKVTHTEQGKNCSFDIKVIARRLLEAHQKSYFAIDALKRQDLSQACNNARTAMEFAIKDKIGIDRKDRRSFHHILGAIKGTKWEFQNVDFKEARDAYNLLSEVEHGIRHGEEEIIKAVWTSKDFVFDLDDWYLAEDTKQKIFQSISTS